MAKHAVERISKADLRRLARIAADERDDFFARHPEWRLLYGRRVLCTALCGQSALHYCNGSSGVDQFDLWTFYARHAEAPFPHYRVSYRDFGRAKFGREDGMEGYVGRRIRLTSRSLSCRPSDNPIAALQAYLRGGRSPSARQLRRAAVVMIEPHSCLSYVAWPTLVV